jgi:hypothetical protein
VAESLQGEKLARVFVGAYCRHLSAGCAGICRSNAASQTSRLASSAGAKNRKLGWWAFPKLSTRRARRPIGGQHSATLNADRVLLPPSNRAIVLDCYGKSLDQLRAMGRLIPLERMSATSPLRRRGGDLIQKRRNVGAVRVSAL